jgi:hypothetical protein
LQSSACLPPCVSLRDLEHVGRDIFVQVLAGLG